MSHTVSRVISDETLNRIITIESAGRVHAKAVTSSATGLGQFLNGTWMATVATHRPDWLSGRTRSEVLNMRLDPKRMIEMLARFTEDNAKALGPGYTDGDLYLAHFSGVGVARRLLRAGADEPTTSHYSMGAIHANRSILEGKTVGQVRAWANSKMEKAGGRNWVAQYMGGAQSTIAKPEPIKPKVTKETAAGTAGGAIVTGTVATGANQGWGFSEWAIAIGVLIALGFAGYVLWSHWQKRKANQLADDDARYQAQIEEK